MNNNNGLENITKYLLNYLFKKIDDLTAENQKLKLIIEEKQIEDNLLNNLVKDAMNMAKDLGLVNEEDDNPIKFSLNKKKEEA